MDRGAWWATVHRVAKRGTRLKWLSTHAECRKGCRCRARAASRVLATVIPKQLCTRWDSAAEIFSRACSPGLVLQGRWQWAFLWPRRSAVMQQVPASLSLCHCRGGMELEIYPEGSKWGCMEPLHSSWPGARSELPLWLWQAPARPPLIGSMPRTLSQTHCPCQPRTLNSGENHEARAFPCKNQDTGFLRLVLLQTYLYLGFHMIKKQQDVRLSGLWEKMSQSGHNWLEIGSRVGFSPVFPPLSIRPKCNNMLICSGMAARPGGDWDLQTSTVF